MPPGQGTFRTPTIDPFITEISADVEATPGGEGVGYASEVLNYSREPETSGPRIEIQKASSLVTNELGLSETADHLLSDEPRRARGDQADRGGDDPAGCRPVHRGRARDKAEGRPDTFRVRAPDQREMDFFELSEAGRVAIVEFTQTYYDGSRIPFVVTVTTYPADRNQFAMTAGQLPDD